MIFHAINGLLAIPVMMKAFESIGWLCNQVELTGPTIMSTVFFAFAHKETMVLSIATSKF